MSALKLIGASAGSGKTYTITGEYLKLLFHDASNYKNILAVTFTNKATDEMKSRILKELHLLACNSPESNYFSILQEFLQRDRLSISDEAQMLLSKILHDYSRFSVSTIDSFFMRVLKAFARELGLQTNFTTELDQKAVLTDVADFMISELDKTPDLQQWLQQFALERLKDGKSWDFKAEIIKLGVQIFNEEFKGFKPDFLLKIADKKYISEYKLELEDIQNNFENYMHQLAQQAIAMIENAGFKTEDFLYGKSGVANYYNNVLNNDFEVKKRVQDAIDNGKWVKADSSKRKDIEALVHSGLDSLTRQLADYTNNHIVNYNSACIILKNIYTLSILADLSKVILQYSSENNIFVLANTGELIKKLIEGNDTPFIYEKAGNQFKNFIIDEFQDTSRVQWDNFMPLIANSMSEGNLNLLVGDVKQSIYRWRNGDWKIMAHTIDNVFQNFNIQKLNLETNWRSIENIVLFNNALFEYAAHLLQMQFNPKTEVDNDKGLVKLAYQNQMQLVPNKPEKKGGCVVVSFFDTKEIEDWRTESMNKLLTQIEELTSLGYKQRQIAILVRDQKDAKDIADLFLDYNNRVDRKLKIDFISNESVFIRQSPAVKIIVSALRFLLDSNDLIQRELLLTELSLICNEQNNLKVEKYNVFEDLPQEFTENFDTFSSVPLLELIGRLITIFKLNINKTYIPYIQAFVDSVVLFLNNNYSDIAKFIEWWDDHAEKLNINAPDQQDAIRVMTIHKSKGLEFDNVFIPFCDWDIDHDPRKPNIIWTQPCVAPFDKAPHIPVYYNKNLIQSIFKVDYMLEKENAYIDNLNLLYVALTRAVYNLFVGAPVKKDEAEIKNVGGLLYKTVSTQQTHNNDKLPDLKSFFSDSTMNFKFGSILYLFKEEKSKHKSLKIKLLQYKPVLGNVRQNFQSSHFFDETNDDRMHKINKGVLMHRIFQFIEKKEDVEQVLLKHQLKGEISATDIIELQKQIEQVLTGEPFCDWFGGKWDVRCEAEIIVHQSGSYRPDRVMLRGQKAVVVDYKFGKSENAQYKKQVSRYMKHLENMGYNDIEGYLWYFDQMKLEKVLLPKS